MTDGADGADGRRSGQDEGWESSPLATGNTLRRRILAALEAKMSDFFHEVLEQPSFVYYREFEVGRTDDSKFRRITASETAIKMFTSPVMAALCSLSLGRDSLLLLPGRQVTCTFCHPNFFSITCDFFFFTYFETFVRRCSHVRFFAVMTQTTFQREECLVKATQSQTTQRQGCSPFTARTEH